MSDSKLDMSASHGAVRSSTAAQGRYEAGSVRPRTTARERLLMEASRVLGGSLDFEATLQQTTRLAVPALADWCAVDVLDEETGALRQVAVAHVDAVRAAWARELHRRYPPRPAARRGTLAVARSGRAECYPVVTDVILAAAAHDERHLRMLGELGLQSLLIVPLVARGRSFGALTLGTAESGRRYDAVDLAVAEELGWRAGLAADNARLYAAEQEARRAAQEAAARALALQAVASALVGARTATAVTDAVLCEGARAVGAHRGSVSLVSGDAATLELVSSVGYPGHVIEKWKVVPLEAHFPPTDAARTGAPIFLSTTEERDRHYPHLAELRRDNGGGAMASIPVASGERVLGVIGLNFPEDHPFGDDERAFLTALARQCAHALDRVRLDEAERLARAAAETANRAKSDFLAVMSHELRTPLNAIGGYAELMAMGIRGPITEEQRADLERIRRSQRTLLALINDVLNFAKIEAGRVEYQLGAVDLVEVISQLDDLVAPQLVAKGIAYDSRVIAGDDGPPLAWADADKLRQILLNLLSNAIKFTAPGGRVTVVAGPVDGMAAVRVVDTGAGMPTDQLDVIFEPFVQVRTGLTRPAEGTGLGLAISRDLARSMGGDLVAESALGKGSTFTLTLPLTG